MLQKLLSGGGGYDLIQPSGYMIEAMSRGRISPAPRQGGDPDLKNIAPQFLDKAFDPDNTILRPVDGRHGGYHGQYRNS